MTAKKKTFEESLKRLEEIVAEMEEGELSLEKMMAHFEEGSVLVKDCGNKLEEVESKIEQLVKKGNELATEPMDKEGGDG